MTKFSSKPPGLLVAVEVTYHFTLDRFGISKHHLRSGAQQNCIDGVNFCVTIGGDAVSEGFLLSGPVGGKHLLLNVGQGF